MLFDLIVFVGEYLVCHPEPFTAFEGRLREGSQHLRFFAKPQNDNFERKSADTK